MKAIHDEALRLFSEWWQLDGDLMRCTKCGRAIVASREDEAMVHRAGCPNSGTHPWRVLKSIIADKAIK